MLLYLALKVMSIESGVPLLSVISLRKVPRLEIPSLLFFPMRLLGASKGV